MQAPTLGKVSVNKTPDTSGNSEKVEKKSWGGARTNSGRKNKGITVLENKTTDTIRNHGEEMVEVKYRDKLSGSEHVAKKQRALALLDMLWEKGYYLKDVPAVKEYFDRTRGKAVQPILHGGQVKTIVEIVSSLEQSDDSS